MAKRKLSEREELKVISARQMDIYKNDAMIQKGRHKLSLQEQRCVLYAISQIKPTDEVFQEYVLDLNLFYRVAGLSGESYTELKSILKGLSDKSWWARIDNKGTESLVRWFSTLRTNKGKGTVTIKFHEDMMPYLLAVTSNPDNFYTHYTLQYILPMNSQYSPRLYELLKSYQKNNDEWFFDVDDLKKKLDSEQYKDFYDFKRRVLEPAVEEINKYTDINIAWEAKKEGVKYTRINFYMAAKKREALMKAEIAGRDVLDGQIDIDEIVAQVTDPNSVRAKFRRENM